MADRALAWPGEPSAIIPSLKVDRVAADPSEDFGYYPGYDRITPAQRRSYLEWLATGRADADPARRSLGHLFVFFYGLERRTVLEGVPLGGPYPMAFCFPDLPAAARVLAAGSDQSVSGVSPGQFVNKPSDQR